VFEAVEEAGRFMCQHSQPLEEGATQTTHWTGCKLANGRTTPRRPKKPATEGDKIRELRKAKGYTLDKLAELAESSKSLHLGTREQEPAPAIGGQSRQDCRGARRYG
jgi:hypothetical protein